jgi:hypothetical protein
MPPRLSSRAGSRRSSSTSAATATTEAKALSPARRSTGVGARDGREGRGRVEARELVGAGQAVGGPRRERGRDLGVRRDAAVVEVGEEGGGCAGGGVRQLPLVARLLARASRDGVPDVVERDATCGRALRGGDREDGQRGAVELLEGPRHGIGGEQRVGEVEEVGDARGVDPAVADEGRQGLVVERAQAGREHQGVGHGRPASGTGRPRDDGDGR